MMMMTTTTAPAAARAGAGRAFQHSAFSGVRLIIPHHAFPLARTAVTTTADENTDIDSPVANIIGVPVEFLVRHSPWLL